MRRLALVAPVVGLVLVGCSDEAPDPKIAPTPTDTSSAAPSPTSDPTPTGPVEPTLPAEAAGTDAAAAEAFVAFYWEMVNYAQATGDVSGLRDLGSPSCAACDGGLESIQVTYDAGGSITGGEVTVDEAKAADINSRTGSAYVVELTVETTDQVTRLPGAQPTRRRGGTVDMEFVVQTADGRWVVGRWEIVS